MRITFTDLLSGRITNEGSSLSVVAKFWDDSTETWTANTPTNIYYRLDSLGGAVITDWTSVTAASSATITLTGTQNAIIDDCKQSEARQLTVTANRGLSTQFSDVYVYRVKNLQGQT